MSYESKKMEKIINKSLETKQKEVKIGLSIADHDLQTKIKMIQRFLDKDMRVKVSMQFRGRELTKHDRGKVKFNNIISSVDGKVMTKPTLNGNIMYMWIVPK